MCLLRSCEYIKYEGDLWITTVDSKFDTKNPNIFAHILAHIFSWILTSKRVWVRANNHPNNMLQWKFLWIDYIGIVIFKMLALLK